MTRKNEKTAAVWVCLGFVALSGNAFATDEEYTLGASSVWSSWYWPRMDSVNPNMYDDGECMDRYDAFDIPGVGEETSQQWEADPDNHGNYSGVGSWQGHCHAWSAASIWEPQPTGAEMHSGVEFRITDKKALLTELYIDGLVFENRQIFQTYPTPGDLWRHMRNEIQGLAPTESVAKPVVLDLSPNEDEEWNYPVFRYKVTYSGTSPNISGRCGFTMRRITIRHISSRRLSIGRFRTGTRSRESR